MIERKGGRTFSLWVLLSANFVFLFSKFSTVLSSLRAVPPRCSFFPSMLLFAPLLAAPVFVFTGDLDTGRMRFWKEQTPEVVSSAGLGLF